MPYIGGNLQPGEAKSISELDTDRPPYESFDDSFRSRSGNVIFFTEKLVEMFSLIRVILQI